MKFTSYRENKYTSRVLRKVINKQKIIYNNKIVIILMK